MTDLTPQTPPAEHPEPCAEPQRPARWKRILKRTLITLAVIVGVLMVAGVLVYEFGGMSGSVHPELFGQYDQLVASGKAPAIQKRFVIPIPGCLCHSTDPVQTARHQVYRMSECGRCHNGGETASE